MGLSLNPVDSARAAPKPPSEIGSIEPRKRADFVVLDQDLLALDPEEIGGVRPRETWIDGERVYARDVLPVA